MSTEEKGRILNAAEEAIVLDLFQPSWVEDARVAMAALSGVTWIGSFATGVATLSSQLDQKKSTKLMYLWVREHEIKFRVLTDTINRIFERFDSFGSRIKERIESEDYLSLVRKAFQSWDRAETIEKREMLRRLVTNAGGITIAQDDWVRMYIEWIEKYHEFHFHVIREIYEKPRVTRRNVWLKLRGTIPREDSAEADLFRLLIRDLSTGGVIRQVSTSRSKAKSAFDGNDPYVLTELGKQFVHYVMSETAPQLNQGDEARTE